MTSPKGFQHSTDDDYEDDDRAIDRPRPVSLTWSVVVQKTDVQED
jgi:hypothetical protein